MPLLRVVFLAVIILSLAFMNSFPVSLHFFGWNTSASMTVVIVGSALAGFLLSRWQSDFQQISLIKVVQEYSKKVIALENELLKLRSEKDGKRG